MGHAGERDPNPSDEVRGGEAAARAAGGCSSASSALERACSAPRLTARVGLSGWVLVAAAANGCQQSEDRPPYAEDLECDGGQCGPVVVNPRPPTGSVPPPGGADGGLGDDLAEALEAAVSLARTPDLMTTQRLDGVPLSVRLARQPSLELARANGSEPFTVPAERLPAWLTIRPREAAEGIFPTTQWASPGPSPQQLLVLDRVAMGDIAESLVLSPTTPNPALGHALVTFVDEQGAPLPGVSVDAPGGIVAYDLGATFTDATMQTDQRGSVAWMNVPSAGPELPMNLRINYQGTRNVSLPIAADTVTLARVALR